ncbi:hypothetical protein [Capnocytophaga sp. oral taxon 326]|uniref:hypothetical protein n=1 Tax=Capnocytophaga sp. oral taxon 326 TaxID=712212 RepID=UPI000347171B|nr:hypothetical protein [Capnocytophaga sp. oral taxon 326]
MRTFLFLIFILSYSQNMFSQTKTDIDTIYKQDFEDFSLQLVRDDSGEKQAEFRTLFINKKASISTKIFISTYKKDLHWIFGKSIGEGAYYTYNIIKGFHLENRLLVFYSCWGVVTAVSFDLTTMTHKTYYIGFYPHTGAFANLVHSMVAKEFRNIFYFHIQAGQQYGGKANILGYFDPKTNEMYNYIPRDTLGIKVSDIDKSFETLKEDKETSVFIRKLLIRLKLAPDNVAISYLFRSEYQNFTYFFYIKDNSSVEILRYDIEKKEWFVGGYNASPSLTSEKP